MRARLVVRTLSELCVTAGTLIVLLVVYVLYWTGVRADHAMDGAIDRLQDQWSAGPVERPRPPATGDAADGSTPPARGGGERAAAPPARGGDRARGTGAAPGGYRDGRAFAVMYIPRFGSGWAKPVLQGTGTEVLKKGLGHYDRTAPLGAVGNFAVAGHRRTYGDPFKDVPELRPGDAVVLTDGTTWYTYRVDRAPYRTRPEDIGVIDPVPAASGFRGPGRYLTLTTCEPEWGHSHRLIVWARLDGTRPVSDGRPGALSG
ncbi:sortase [Streptomyces albireticuli]|uniref:Sortase n=1 Tax=Streptomyces albireticuli TaxID=1940 RepID=A0A1Z2L458_9ACTN|nr:class E sortase [Streptomyces albireticuli]ARZ69093.1 sortase [Streptomyces albireticuli]